MAARAELRRCRRTSRNTSIWMATMTAVSMVKGQRDRVVRDVGRHRRERWHPGIERPGANEGEQQRGQNHQTEPAMAKDIAVPDPRLIDDPYSPQVR